MRKKYAIISVEFIDCCENRVQSQPDPPENCHLTVKKLAKNLTFFQKKLPKIFIKKKNAI